jgi:DNA-binding response OmpR family regulator
MSRSESPEERPSVLLVDENGRLPGHHDAWLDRDRKWRARRVETLVEAVQRMGFEPTDSVLFAPSAMEMIDCASTLHIIRLLHPEIVVGLVVDAAPAEEIRWLDAGADFVLGLPFVVEQAAARLRAALRLQCVARKRGLDRPMVVPDAPPRHGMISLGEGFRFDPASGLVINLACQALDLTPHELAVLKVLAQRPNRPFSRDDICRAAYGRPWQYGDRSVDRAIMSLRKRLDLDPARGPIRSRRNAGYVLLTSEDDSA